MNTILALGLMIGGLLLLRGSGRRRPVARKVRIDERADRPPR